MNAEDMIKRTKKFAVGIVRLIQDLPSNKVADVLGKQLLRSGTSVGANYRSACHAKSQPDFIAKMGIVEEEADECIYWLELLVESGLLSQEKAKPFISEASQLVNITVASIKTARGNLRN